MSGAPSAGRICVIGGGVAGSLLASRFTTHIDAQRLQRGFAVLVLATASAVVLQVTTS